MHTVDGEAKVFENVKDYRDSEANRVMIESSPSDYIVIDKDGWDVLDNIIEKFSISNNPDVAKIGRIPADLVVSGRIPLPDCYIRTNLDYANTGTLIEIRFLYTKGDLWVHFADNMYPPMNLVFRYCFLYNDASLMIPDLTTVYPVNVSANRYILGLVKIDEHDGMEEYVHTLVDVVNQYAYWWYAIQLMLTHPAVEKHDILRRSGKEKIPGGLNSNSKSKKRKAKYIKRYYINDIEKTHPEFTRKTMSWYVIGHYRKHGDGKVWVNGYWKGPLRHLKKNTDGGRERLLNIERN